MNSAHSTVTLGGVLRWFSFLALFGALLWYAAFQARLLIAGPSLALDTSTTILHDTRVTTLRGIAHNVTEITLNNRPIFTDDDGNFHEQLVLERGYTIMTLRAKDRYGRETILAQPFVYTPTFESPRQKPY